MCMGENLATAESLVMDDVGDFVSKPRWAFVGGAPRSGTTLLQALLSTASFSNDYIAECGYFSTLITSYIHGCSRFSDQTKYYFKDLQDFDLFHRGLLKMVLEKISSNIGNPETLLLKDPLLTPHFDLVSELLPEAIFIVSVRSPLATVASRLHVMKRAGDWTEGDLSKVERCCDEYNFSYSGTLRGRASMGSRLHIVKYEDILKYSFSDIPADFRNNLCLSKLWENSLTDINESNVGPWRSQLYGGPITPPDDHVPNEGMSKEIKDLVLSRCGDTANMLGYP